MIVSTKGLDTYWYLILYAFAFEKKGALKKWAGCLFLSQRGSWNCVMCCCLLNYISISKWLPQYSSKIAFLLYSLAFGHFVRLLSIPATKITWKMIMKISGRFWNANNKFASQVQFCVWWFVGTKLNGISIIVVTNLISLWCVVVIWLSVGCAWCVRSFFLHLHLSFSLPCFAFTQSVIWCYVAVSILCFRADRRTTMVNEINSHQNYIHKTNKV